MTTDTVIPPSLIEAQPPIVPKGLAKTTIVVSCFLGSLAFVIVALRLAVRTWLFRSGTRAFGLDDLFTIAALAPFISACVYTVRACYYGIGTRDVDLTPLQMMRATQFNTYWQLSYVLSVPFCKIAIASALFRVTNRTRYRVLLWFVVILSSIVCAVAVLSLLLVCKPWAALWNPTLGQCGKTNILLGFSYSVTVCSVITDLTCSIVPYFVLKDLQLPVRVRYSLIAVLSLGVFASIGAVARIPYFKYYTHTTDVLYQSAKITIWSNIESGVGIIAASAPPLRRFFHCLRETVGSSGKSKDNSQGHSKGLSQYAYDNSKGSQVKHKMDENHSVQLESIKFGGVSSVTANGPRHPKGEGWERMDDDEGQSFSSQRNIMQSTTIRVETDSLDSRWDSVEGRPGV